LSERNCRRSSSSSSSHMPPPDADGDPFSWVGSRAASSLTRSAYLRVLSECSHELSPGLIIAIWKIHYIMNIVLVCKCGAFTNWPYHEKSQVLSDILMTRFFFFFLTKVTQILYQLYKYTDTINLTSKLGHGQWERMAAIMMVIKDTCSAKGNGGQQSGHALELESCHTNY
jgi:hypothetical protein